MNFENSKTLKKKYLKYKNKYLELKKTMKGGGNPESELGLMNAHQDLMKTKQYYLLKYVNNIDMNAEEALNILSKQFKKPADKKNLYGGQNPALDADKMESFELFQGMIIAQQDLNKTINNKLFKHIKNTNINMNKVLTILTNQFGNESKKNFDGGDPETSQQLMKAHTELMKTKQKIMLSHVKNTYNNVEKALNILKSKFESTYLQYIFENHNEQAGGYHDPFVQNQIRMKQKMVKLQLDTLIWYSKETDNMMNKLVGFLKKLYVDLSTFLPTAKKIADNMNYKKYSGATQEIVYKDGVPVYNDTKEPVN
jgi:hypothetical protein